MRKTVLIPTDFSIESLTVLKNFLHQADDQYTYDIILLHGTYLSDSISDLLFFSKGKILKELTNEAFEEACMILKNKFASKINSLRKDLYTGYTQSAFNSYVDANRITVACIPANFQWNLSNKKSFDLMPFINKSDVRVEEIGWKPLPNVPEKGKLAELFFSMPSHS
ncbi:MAG: hypothetical protein ACK4UK_03460 [Flavobacterium sp.]